jgi:RNA polymerase sigma-70 factor (sigma-E family)
MRILHRRTPDGDLDFAEFVREVSPRLLRTAYLLSGSQDSAEDLVQEALERVCRRWHRIARTQAPEAYTRQIVVNLANDRWRHIVRFREGDHAQVFDRPDPRDEYTDLDVRDQLGTLLMELPMKMRTVIVLRYLHDMDNAQIADLMNITPNTVRSQLSRGLTKLRAIAVTAEGCETGGDERTAQPMYQELHAHPAHSTTRLTLGDVQ